MKSIILLTTAFLIFGSISAQKRFGTTDGVSVVETDYMQFDENASKYFWAIDLDIFTASQKSTFQESVFNNDLLIACSTPDQHNIWYLSSFKSNEISLVKTELEKLISKAKLLTNNPKDKYQ